MEIQGPQIPPSLILAKGSFSLQNLQAGQEVVAKVIEQLPSKNEVVIQIGRQLIRVNSSDVSVSVGQTLKAIVQKTNNEIVLTIKQEATASNIISPALKQLLPKQLPVQQLLTPLTQLLNRLNNAAPLDKATGNLQVKNLAQLSTSIKNLLTQIASTTANVNQLSTPSELKTSLQNSGNFLEAKIQQSITSKAQTHLETPAKTTSTEADIIIGGKRIPRKNIQALIETATNTVQQSNLSSVTQVDGKANLIRLITLLKQWPTSQAQATAAETATMANKAQNPKQAPLPTPLTGAQNHDTLIRDLLAKSEGALSKIILNQLASTTTENTATRQSWQFDIPFFNGQTTESFFIKFEQYKPKKTTDEDDKKWTVSLEMNPPNLGLIKNKLTINGSQINSQFWCKEAATSSLIRKNLSLFKSQLTRAQLQTESIQVHTGSGPDFHKPLVENAILSEKA